MKKPTIASKVEKHWTVLLVDGHGRIRRIPHFRRKLWTIAGLCTGALLLAVVMGLLYGGILQQRIALTGQVNALQDQIIEMRQQNELLKARAVRLESRAASPQIGQKPGQAATAPPKAEQVPTQPAPSKVQGAEPAPEAADRAPAATPTPSAALEKPDETPKPQVDAEDLKITYQADNEMIEARFVIRNTGQVPAGGRTVLVLHTEKGRSQVHLALPTVLLKDGRPLGNGGQRFSITRFMTMSLERKFAEPGTRFVGAVMYAYSLEGDLLLEKPFDVTLDIPEAQASPNPLPVSDPLGLELPASESEPATGVQP
jgi:hypothetical protein